MDSDRPTPTADFSRPPCYPARLIATATPCPRTPPRPRHGNPCAVAVGPWFMRTDRGQDVSLKTPVPRSPPWPHRPRNIARRHVSQRCTGPRGLRLRGTLPPPAAPMQRDTHLCCTLFHIAGKSLESHGFARSWPVQQAQCGCFTRLRRTAPAPHQGLCNRPRRHGASCFTGGDGGVRHRDDPGTPNETSRPACFTGLRGRDPDPSGMQGIKVGAALTPSGFPPIRPDHFSRRTAPLEAGATTGPDVDARARVFFRTRRVP